MASIFGQIGKHGSSSLELGLFLTGGFCMNWIIIISNLYFTIFDESFEEG